MLIIGNLAWFKVFHIFVFKCEELTLQMYLDFRDEVTVYIGPENVKKFFTMDKFHGSDRFNYWPDEICDSVKTATEGVIYPQFLTRNDSLSYFRKTMCRITPVVYAGEQDNIFFS